MEHLDPQSQLNELRYLWELIKQDDQLIREFEAMERKHAMDVNWKTMRPTIDKVRKERAVRKREFERMMAV